MTSIPPTPGFSRFHAIVTATPRDGFGPPVINTDYLRPSSYALASPVDKRKHQSDDEDDFSGGKPVWTDKRSAVARKAIGYDDCLQLLNALKAKFQEGSQSVEFHGYFHEDGDPGVSHKQRVQTLTNDIWRTTGYRFTVKDHPKINDGHKTRFWCSQDKTHKSRLKAAKNIAVDPKPRLTSTGDVMAKPRYPCNSRLLISSRESGKAGRRIITVRLGHHMAHEPYVDAALMPDMVKSIWETFGWTGQLGEPLPSDHLSTASRNGQASNAMAREMDLTGHSQDEDCSDDGEGPTGYTGLSENTSQGSPLPPSPAQLDFYHQRMKSHISNIREFCDGLEYNLQFGDTRMLEVVEREGSSFLNLVEECLRKEGRLSNAPEPTPSSRKTNVPSDDLAFSADHVPTTKYGS